MAGLNDTEKADVKRALEQMVAHGQEVPSGDDEDSGARQRLIASARDLIFAAEDPQDTLLWHMWGESTHPAVARVAVDLELFETVTSDGGRPKTLEELSAPTQASPKLVKRISRACLVMRWLNQDRPDHYVPNKVTHRLVEPGGSDGIVFCFESQMPSITRMPEFLRNTSFRNPEGGSGPFQYGHQINHGIFDWFTKDRHEVFQAFHKYIFTIRNHRPSWLDMYPAVERLATGLSSATDDSSAFVDIGGSMALDLEEFRACVPSYTGRFVLQELPGVIEAIRATGTLHVRLELQPHDFFTPQPVQGAHAYFLRMVLHDWSDEKSRIILGHLRDAMEPGYLRVLISECVVADENPAWQHAALDISMMSLATALERSESEWHDLIESCGLRIERI